MSETIQEIKCPACQKIMKKVFVPKEGLNVDICLDGCGGMYFDNRELKCFDEQTESVDEIVESISGKQFDQVDQSNTRFCPSCGAKMVKNFTSIKKQVQIDECYSCGGKFLDAKELQLLRGEYATEAERSADVIKLIDATVGPELIKMMAEHEEYRKHRSPLKRLFDSLVESTCPNI